MTKFAGRLCSTLGGAVILTFCFLFLRRSSLPNTRNTEDAGRVQKLQVQGPLRVEQGDVWAGRGRGAMIGDRELDKNHHTTPRGGVDPGVAGERVGAVPRVGPPAPPPNPGSNQTSDRDTGHTDRRGTACDDECFRFSRTLHDWPESKPKAAIYLLTHSSRLSNLRRILSQLDQYFNDQFHYPIIIFHEKNLRKFLTDIRGYTNSDIYFQEIYFELPSFITKPVVFNIPCISHISYRHMCRFHAKGVYEEPIMQNMELVWRLDDDSEILKPVKYDVFAFMKQHNYMYGYVFIHWDALVCTTGLWNATADFIKSRNITAKFFDEWRQPRLYYNNFEISNLQLWMSRGYKDYIDYIDRLGGIFYHRWGDAPIKGIAVSMFVNKNETYSFNDIAYRHRSMNNSL